MKPKVAIIILNWNGWKDTIECLESIYQIKYPNYEVIVVDNASKDDSLERIRSYCKGNLKIKSKFFKYSNENKPIKIFEYTEKEIKTLKIREKEINDIPSNKKLIIIKNNENYGFAEGNNIGMKYVLNYLKTDYALLLNNDTVVDKHFLDELIKVGESSDNVGIIGSKIYYYDFNGKNDVIWCIGGKVDLTKYPGHYGVNDTIDISKYDADTVECDWVSGAALMIKIKEVPIKFLNTDLFFGCEDVDLAIMLKKHGYNATTALNSKIWHKTGASRKKKAVVDRTFLEIKNSLSFLKMHNKHYYLFLPLYIAQMTKMYSLSLLKKIFREN